MKRVILILKKRCYIYVWLTTRSQLCLNANWLTSWWREEWRWLWSNTVAIRISWEVGSQVSKFYKHSSPPLAWTLRDCWVGLQHKRAPVATSECLWLKYTSFWRIRFARTPHLDEVSAPTRSYHRSSPVIDRFTFLDTFPGWRRQAQERLRCVLLPTWKSCVSMNPLRFSADPYLFSTLPVAIRWLSF